MAVMAVLVSPISAMHVTVLPTNANDRPVRMIITEATIKQL